MGAANCGHIHILIDGSACTPMGSPYNNDNTTGSPALAIVSNCPTATGAHTITLELHNDDHSPINGPNNMVISASVMVTVM
jgi:hypothetical protein